MWPSHWATARTWCRKFSASAASATRRAALPASNSSALQLSGRRTDAPPALPGVAGEVGRGLDEAVPVQGLEVVAHRPHREPGPGGEPADTRRTLDLEQLGEPAPGRVVEGHQDVQQVVAGPGGGVPVALVGGTSGHGTTLTASATVVQAALYDSGGSEARGIRSRQPPGPSGSLAAGRSSCASAPFAWSRPWSLSCWSWPWSAPPRRRRPPRRRCRSRWPPSATRSPAASTPVAGTSTARAGRGARGARRRSTATSPGCSGSGRSRRTTTRRPGRRCPRWPVRRPARRHRARST